jgi:ABC-2 type transport system permease protein
MTGTLFRKLLRDVRLPLLIVALLLALFQCLWAVITHRISGQLLPEIGQAGLPIELLKALLFKGPGKIVQTLLGGETIQVDRPQDMFSIGYVHPLTQVILCVWAIGRSAGALTGEIDRGTIELLLAQPVSRARVVWAHVLVDCFAIPILCLSLWSGTCVGAWLAGLWDGPPGRGVDPLAFAPALLNVAALLLAISGYTLWLSAWGRFRGRVLGVAVLVTLLQFLVNVVGQLWDVAEPLRPFTVFYYYQPQQIILNPDWVHSPTVWRRLGVLLAVGAAGYLGALATFTRRDLPAPL